MSHIGLPLPLVYSRLYPHTTPGTWYAKFGYYRTIAFMYMFEKNSIQSIHKNTHTHLDIISPPRVDPNFLTHFSGKGGLSIFKWSTLSMFSVDWNI